MKRVPYFFAGLLLSFVSLTAVFAEPLNSGIDLSGMDTTVRPQDDFFRYANGTWLKNNEIPADKSRYGSFIILYDQSQQDIRAIVDALAANEKLTGDEKKVADYYASYMDEARVNELSFTPLKAKLAEIDAISSLKKLAAYFGAKSGGPVPFGFYINQDRKQSTRYVAYLTQGGLGLPDRDYYLTDNEKFATIRTEYQQHLEKVLGLIGEKNPAASAKTIFELEHQLAGIQWSRVENRDAEKTYNRYDDLAAVAPHFEWNSYLAASALPSKGPFIVRQPSYFQQLDELIKNTPLSSWQVYLKWHLVNSYSSVLSKEFVDARFEFYGTALSGQQQQRPRWKRGIRSTSGVLGEAIG
ncbi:MAG: M13 family metallopeptidase, partial [Gammaproteobacteria bacterium]|nr:M13 family metallopeptidase [Gammaproteobacteria bacterium]